MCVCVVHRVWVMWIWLWFVFGVFFFSFRCVCRYSCVHSYVCVCCSCIVFFFRYCTKCIAYEYKKRLFTVDKNENSFISLIFDWLFVYKQKTIGGCENQHFLLHWRIVYSNYKNVIDHPICFRSIISVFTTWSFKKKRSS